MTQPDSRQALIERLGYLTTLSREAWGIADDADIVPITVGELRTVVLALRQADEEIERVKKENEQYRQSTGGLPLPNPTVGLNGDGWMLWGDKNSIARVQRLAHEAEGVLPVARSELIAARASLSAVTLRNEKLREALSSIVDSKFRHTEGYAARLGAAQRIARAALQLSPDPATPQETKP